MITHVSHLDYKNSYPPSKRSSPSVDEPNIITVVYLRNLDGRLYATT